MTQPDASQFTGGLPADRSVRHDLRLPGVDKRAVDHTVDRDNAALVHDVAEDLVQTFGRRRRAIPGDLQSMGSRADNRRSLAMTHSLAATPTVARGKALDSPGEAIRGHALRSGRGPCRLWGVHPGVRATRQR